MTKFFLYVKAFEDLINRGEPLITTNRLLLALDAGSPSMTNSTGQSLLIRLAAMGSLTVCIASYTLLEGDRQ